jgi:hypothetical protein
MAVTAETLPHAVAHLREALPRQVNQVNLPQRAILTERPRTSASVVRHTSTVGRQPAAPLTRCDGAEVVGAAVVLRTTR